MLKAAFSTLTAGAAVLLTAGAAAAAEVPELPANGEVRDRSQPGVATRDRTPEPAAPSIRPGGTVTLTSGFLARRTTPGTLVKTTMNAALEAAAGILALELAPLRVNVVSPGFTDTYEGAPDPARPKMLADAAARLPAGRVAQPADLAAAYLFLIDNPSATGSTVDIDGGALIA